MAIGALGAYLVHHRAPILRMLYSRFGQILTIILVVIMGYVIPPATPFHHAITSFVFAALIVILSTSPRPLLRLEHPLFKIGGDLSYGIYMLHPLVIYATLLILHALGQGDNALALNGIAITGTLALAFVSHRLIEQPFLRLKTRYETVYRSQSEPTG